jgi:hypothetical protein
LQRRALKLVEEWVGLHRDELLADWKRAEREEPLQDVEYFATVAVDPDLGTVVWPNGADLAPDVLHQQALSLA